MKGDTGKGLVLTAICLNTVNKSISRRLDTDHLSTHVLN